MLKNYLKIAIRNLLKYKLFSFTTGHLAEEMKRVIPEVQYATTLRPQVQAPSVSPAKF